MASLIDKLIQYMPRIKKAIMAGIAAVTSMYAGFQLSEGTVNGWEWLALVGAFLAAGLATFATRNAEPTAGTQPPGPPV